MISFTLPVGIAIPGPPAIKSNNAAALTSPRKPFTEAAEELTS
jgi:hypothetical protein